MKIAVYTITKDEEQFIQQWAESCRDADVQLVVDTGSSDKTLEVAQEHGCETAQISITPWRFDDARNAALSLVPEDVDFCIALDADEVLQPGWREALEQAPDDATRVRYKYVWSWNSDGSEGLIYGGDKIHRRHGYRWKHPVHEVVTPTGQEVEWWADGLVIHHHPDEEKPRSQYLPLLELAAKESPSCDRTAHYLAREYLFSDRLEEAGEEFKRHLSLPSAQWAPERAASMRYLAKCEPERAESWLLRACAESDRRESWVALADYYYSTAEMTQCYAACKKALRITEKPLDYLCEPHAWNYHVYDMAAYAAWAIGMTSEAKILGERALELFPDSERLQENMKFYQPS